MNIPLAYSYASGIHIRLITRSITWNNTNQFCVYHMDQQSLPSFTNRSNSHFLLYTLHIYNAGTYIYRTNGSFYPMLVLSIFLICGIVPFYPVLILRMYIMWTMLSLYTRYSLYPSAFVGMRTSTPSYLKHLSFLGSEKRLQLCCNLEFVYL